MYSETPSAQEESESFLVKNEQNSNVLEQQELPAPTPPSFPYTSALENAQNCSLTEEYQVLSLTTKNFLNIVQATARKNKGEVFSPLSNTRTYFL